MLKQMLVQKEGRKGIKRGEGLAQTPKSSIFVPESKKTACDSQLYKKKDKSIRDRINKYSLLVAKIHPSRRTSHPCQDCLAYPP